ncbi:hypothetical protein CPC08DRAFT_768852 [Agrocybe pediades]|nr:hypothetical protein CPC08DRAFT_768852 [Agrocybe pediades]
MFILASILLSRSTNTNNSFSSIPDVVFPSSFPGDTDPTPPCPRRRIQIIWACVATILAASWVSVHPNIPNPKESAIMKTLLRIKLMIWAILTPELIILWAMRQWYVARLMEREFAEFQHIELESTTRKLLRRLKKLGYKLRHFRASENEELTPLTQEPPRRMKRVKWTRTHGFFLQMGGFMLREEGKEDRVLMWKPLMEYCKLGRLDLSDITEDRINDRSKADGFAKGLALLQMFWFIAQCVARFVDKNLNLTELELATAALAILSFVLYFLWWNKPFNAGIPIIITLLPTKADPYSKDDANSRLEFAAHTLDTSLRIPDTFDSDIPHTQPVKSMHSSDYGVDEAIPLVETNLHIRLSVPVNPASSHVGSASEDSNIAFAPPQVLRVLILESILFRVHSQLDYLAPHFVEFMGSKRMADPFDVPGDTPLTSVPKLYSIPVESIAYLQMALATFLATALFGSIHCIGWSSKIVFTSQNASSTWRIASAAVTLGPVMWCLTLTLVLASATFKAYALVLARIFIYLAYFCLFLSVISLPIYILARIALLVVALSELQHVPPGALANIHWANVLPFIH